MSTAARTNGDDTAATTTTGTAAAPAKRGVCALIRQYGVVFLGAFAALWAVTFTIVLTVVRSGLDTIALMEWVGVHRLFGWADVRSHVDPRYGELGVAYLVTGITEPVRIAIVLYVTPTVDRWVRATFPRFSARVLPAAAPDPTTSPLLRDAEAGAAGLDKQA